MVQAPVSPNAASENPLTSEELRKIHAYWRACNYLAAGMIYLRDNPLLKEPLAPEHIKYRLLGQVKREYQYSFGIGDSHISESRWVYC